MNIFSKYLANKELSNTLLKLSLMRDFSYNYFNYAFMTTKSFLLRQEIIQDLSIVSQGNDIDLFCDVIQKLPKNLSNFWNSFIDDLTVYFDKSIYLSYPIKSLLNFIETNNILDCEELNEYNQNFDVLGNNFRNLIENHITTSVSSHCDAMELCDFMREQFPSYCSAKKGHPLLRAISRIAGGFLGGYIAGSFESDLKTCLNLGSLASDGLEAATEVFTSGTSQNKVSSYESLIEDATSAIMAQFEEIQVQFDDFRHDCNELIESLHKEIEKFIIKNKLRKKEIQDLTRSINYLYNQPRGISKYFKNTENVLHYIKENNYLNKKEYKQLLKLL